jgi:hypothetical protein
LNGWLVFTNKAIVRGLDPVGRESPRMIIPDDSYESASKKHAELLGTLYLLGPGKTLENTVAPGTERDVPGNEKSVPAEDDIVEELAVEVEVVVKLAVDDAVEDEVEEKVKLAVDDAVEDEVEEKVKLAVDDAVKVGVVVEEEVVDAVVVLVGVELAVDDNVMDAVDEDVAAAEKGADGVGVQVDDTDDDADGIVVELAVEDTDGAEEAVGVEVGIRAQLTGPPVVTQELSVEFNVMLIEGPMNPGRQVHVYDVTLSWAVGLTAAFGKTGRWGR